MTDLSVPKMCSEIVALLAELEGHDFVHGVNQTIYERQMKHRMWRGSSEMSSETYHSFCAVVAKKRVSGSPPS